MAQKSSDQTRAQMSIAKLEEEVPVLKRKNELEEVNKSASKKIKLEEIFPSGYANANNVTFDDSDSDDPEEVHDSDSDREYNRTNEQEELDEKMICLQKAERALSKAPPKHVQPALDHVKDEIKKLITEENQMHARWVTEDKNREEAEEDCAREALQEALCALDGVKSVRDVIEKQITSVGK